MSINNRESQLSDLDRRLLDHVKHTDEKAALAREDWQKRNLENYLEIDILKNKLDKFTKQSILMSDHCVVKYNTEISEENISSGRVNSVILKFRNSLNYYSFSYEKSNVLLKKYHHGDSEVKEKILFDLSEIDKKIEEIFGSYYYSYVKDCENASRSPVSELHKGTYEKYVFLAVILAFFSYLYVT